MFNILDKIVAHKRREITALTDQKINTPTIIKNKRKKSFKEALEAPGLSVIGEIKRRSPSKGIISEIESPVELAEKYNLAEVSAISILTDERFFSGKIEDLQEVAKISRAPLLRKDFIIDPKQIIESVNAGANAILLIVSVLKEKTVDFIKLAKQYGCDALVEVHDITELSLAIESGADIIGVNNRNLETFEVDLKNSLDLIKHIPSHILSVAESGVKSIDDAKMLKNAGFDAILIGEALVKNKYPTEFIKALRNV